MTDRLIVEQDTTDPEQPYGLLTRLSEATGLHRWAIRRLACQLVEEITGEKLPTVRRLEK